MATVTFPNSYLSTASQPWGRIVEKQLVDLNLLVTSNEINNAARDKQLLASLNRTNATAISAQAAADAANAALADIGAVKTNIYVPGTTQINGTSIKTGTISADKISAGTLTGFTINTAASGQRVEMYGAGIYFYSPTYVGSMVGSTKNGYQIIDITGGGLNVAGPIWSLNTLNAVGQANLTGGCEVSNGNLTVNGTTYSSILNVSNGNLSADASSVYSAGIYSNTTSQQYNVHIQGSANNYKIYRSTYTSTRALKRDIRELTFDQDAYINISPVVFKYVDGVLREEEKDWDIVGFIAEDFEEAGLSEHLITQPQSDDEHISLRYDKMYMFLHSVVKSQNETIKNLTTRLGALENK